MAPMSTNSGRDSPGLALLVLLLAQSVDAEKNADDDSHGHDEEPEERLQCLHVASLCAFTTHSSLLTSASVRFVT